MSEKKAPRAPRNRVQSTDEAAPDVDVADLSEEVVDATLTTPAQVDDEASKAIDNVLRDRKSGTSTPTNAPTTSKTNAGGSNERDSEPPKSQKKVRTKAENMRVLATSIFAYAPESVQPYLKKIEGAVLFIERCINVTSPFIMAAWAWAEKTYATLEKYQLDILMPMLTGLFLMFFGGSFMLTVACIEAYRIAGWSKTWQCILVLWNTTKNIKQKSEEDDAVDDDKNGVADVLEISESQLVTRKIMLFLKVADPEAIMNAISGIYTGFLGVIATLKIEFARTIVMGSSIGEAMARPALRYLTPIISVLIPEAFHKWIAVIIKSTCKLIGVYIASIFARIMAAAHSGVKGAHTFSTNFSLWLEKNGYSHLANSFITGEVFSTGLMVAGVYWQLRNNFTIPFLLQLPFLPFSILETFLSGYLAYDIAGASPNTAAGAHHVGAVPDVAATIPIPGL